MRSRALLFLVFLRLAGSALAVAQSPPDDPLRDHFFPPELVMQNQQAIGLSDDQKGFFKTELRQAQQRFTELQWKLDDEMERFVTLVKQPQVDEQQALAQLDRVLAAAASPLQHHRSRRIPRRSVASSTGRRERSPPAAFLPPAASAPAAQGVGHHPVDLLRPRRLPLPVD